MTETDAERLERIGNRRCKCGRFYHECYIHSALGSDYAWLRLMAKRAIELEAERDALRKAFRTMGDKILCHPKCYNIHINSIRRYAEWVLNEVSDE